jgi:hypothetical protein
MDCAFRAGFVQKWARELYSSRHGFALTFHSPNLSTTLNRAYWPKAARDAIRAKKISSVELTRQALARIEKLEPKILAFNSTYPERALQQAKEVDEGKRTARWRACRSR